MTTQTDDISERVIKFQLSRRNAETREYVKCIIQKLDDALINDSVKNSPSYKNAGWVRVKILFNDLVGKTIPNQTTFYRLLKDLHDAKLIEKQVQISPGEIGRKPTYYRVPHHYKKSLFMSREELETAYNELPVYIIKRLLIAEEMLNELRGDDLSYHELEERLKTKNEKDLELINLHSKQIFGLYDHLKIWEKGSVESILGTKHLYPT